MKSGRKGKIAAAILSVSVFTWVLGYQMAKGAVFDESKAVTYRQYASSHVIEDSTLFIGTYLIHMQALTDELYEKALDSAADSNQTNIYYKSELAGGAWFDITDAAGLSDISDQGTVISESELADLWVTCCTGSDGITRDARSGGAISIFDTPNPYDLYNLPELEPIRLQYDNVFSSKSTGVDKYYYTKLRAFFGLNLRNETTARCDQQLAGLQTCYESLQRSDQKELAEIVSTLMSRIDARRRAEIFSQLSEIDNNWLTSLQNSCSGQGYSEEDYDDKQFVENTNVTDAIGTSLESCQESYIEHSGKMLVQGETVLKNAEYEKSMQVVNLSAGGWNAQMETLLLGLQDIYHIQDDVVADEERELALLDGELLGTAENKYQQILSEGAGGAYQAAVANGVSRTAKNQVLDDRKSVADGAKSEFQYLILARTKRMPAADAVEYLYGRIERAETFYDRTANDDFRAKAEETIDDHILWLQDLARSVSGEEEGLQSELQKLENRKEELLEKQADALDNNDLSTARKYDALIAQADAEIEAMEQELNAILSSSSSTAAQKAQAANQAGDSTTLNNINQMKNSALSMIAEGNISGNDSLGNMIDSLAALGAESALEEIRNKVADSGNSQLLRDVGRAIEDSKESSLHDLYGGGSTSGTGTAGSGSGSGGTGSGSGGAGSGSGGTGSGSGGAGSGSGGTGSESGGTGSGSGGTGSGSGGAGSGSGEAGSGSGGAGSGSGGTGSGSGRTESGSGSGAAGAVSGLSEGDIQTAIEAVFGDTFDSLSDADKAAATAALNRIGQSGSRQAANLARIYLNQCVKDGNGYIFQKLKGESAEHIPLRLIGLCSGYRYVYSDSRKEVTLTKRSNVCHFTVYSDRMVRQDGSQEKLTTSVKVQNVPYLAEEDAIAYFQCQAEYIDTTDYGVALSVQMQKRVQELVDALQEGEG